MLIKKIAILVVLGLSLATSAFAGPEDWNGAFTFQDSTGEEHSIVHAPNYIQFMFLRVGSCLLMRKGSKMNGMIIPENVEFCTSANVEKFTNEVQKLGLITNKIVKLGPTYTAG